MIRLLNDPSALSESRKLALGMNVVQSVDQLRLKVWRPSVAVISAMSGEANMQWPTQDVTVSRSMTDGRSWYTGSTVTLPPMVSV
jgi:hypothetical protein